MLDNGVFLEQVEKAYLKLKRKESCSLSSQIILEQGPNFTGKQSTGLLVFKASAPSEQLNVLISPLFRTWI